MREMRKMRKCVWVQGQGLPEVLTSMLLLGILMMVGYTVLQNGMGLSSPLQQELHAKMLKEAVWEDFTPGKQEQEMKGRLLKRTITRLHPSEPVFEVKLECFVGERRLAIQKKIIRKNVDHEP